MWKRGLVLVVGMIALAVAVSTLALQPSAQAAAAPKGQVQIDLMVEVKPGGDTALIVSNIGSSGLDGVSCGRSSFNVDSFFDVSYVSNIGSSGEDGVRFIVDSFFDVEYSIAPPTPDSTGRTVQTEILSMDLSAALVDPDDSSQVMDDLRCQVEDAGGTVYYGHVTVLK